MRIFLTFERGGSELLFLVVKRTPPLCINAIVVSNHVFFWKWFSIFFLDCAVDAKALASLALAEEIQTALDTLTTLING